ILVHAPGERPRGEDTAVEAARASGERRARRHLSRRRTGRGPLRLQTCGAAEAAGPVRRPGAYPRRLRCSSSGRRRGVRGRRTVKLLLDTHILLWAALDPERISEECRTAIEDGTNEVYASAVSAW